MVDYDELTTVKSFMQTVDLEAKLKECIAKEGGAVTVEDLYRYIAEDADITNKLIEFSDGKYNDFTRSMTVHGFYVFLKIKYMDKLRFKTETIIYVSTKDCSE